MKRLPTWVRGWFRAPGAPARRPSPRARLSVELLEDRLVLSANLQDPSYQQWAQQRFTVDDAATSSIASATVSAQSAPTNSNFGSLIGLNTVLGSTSDRGAGYSVAVIDTGINYNDPNLGGGWGNRVIAGYNFVNNTSNPMDDNGHGTFVASEIASSSATLSGVAPDCNLIALKVLDSTGSGTYTNVLAALDWVVAHQAQYNIVAINMSLGSGNYTVDPFTYLEGDLATLKADGVFTAVAAGNGYYSNSSQAGLAYPAVSPNVVSVGAVWDGNFGPVAWGSGARDYSTAADQIASFSQRGSALSILAPGAILTGDALNGGTTTMAGTSMATPVVAGAAVLLHEALVDAGMGADANQSYILNLMQSTGKVVVDNNNGTDNVSHTGLSFRRLDLAAAFAAIPHHGGALTLAVIGNQTTAAGQPVNVQLSANDPNGLPVTYTVSVGGTASQAYGLKTSLGLSYAGTYYTNLMGQQEKWIFGTGGTWYCLVPDGELRRWAGSWPATMQSSALVATLDASFYADPSLLWNAAPTTVPATASVNGNVLTVTPNASFQGTFAVSVTASDGTQAVTTTFNVTIAAAAQPPVLAAIADQTMGAGQVRTVALSAQDPNGLPLSFSASVGSATSQALSLRYTLALSYAGNYYTNLMGHQEKWIYGSGGTWYCVLPDGELRRWSGSWAATMQSNALVATLNTSFYTDPSLLWNAQQVAAPATVSINGGTLVITTSPSFLGTFVVTVTASDGAKSTTETFTVTVSAQGSTQGTSAKDEVRVDAPPQDDTNAGAPTLTSQASTVYANVVGGQVQWMDGIGATRVAAQAGTWTATVQATWSGGEAANAGVGELRYDRSSVGPRSTGHFTGIQADSDVTTSSASGFEDDALIFANLD